MSALKYRLLATMRLTAWLVISAALAVADVKAQENDAERKKFVEYELKKVSAPVSYQGLMLVVSDKTGVAAIIFDEEVEKGVNYQFRFRPAAKLEEISGKGLLIEKLKKTTLREQGVLRQLTDGKEDDVDKTIWIDDGSQLHIKAGDLKIEWSRWKKGGGWIYYVPEHMRVQVANADNFKKLDLSRFAWK